MHKTTYSNRDLSPINVVYSCILFQKKHLFEQYMVAHTPT